VPADASEVHSAAKKGNEHREEKITEPGRRPDQRPISASGSCGGRHGHGDVIVYNFRESVFSCGFAELFRAAAATEVIYGK